MSHTLEALALHAVRLPADEKARLARHLPDSLEPLETGDVADAWRQKAELRLDAVAAGTARTVPADDVFATLDRRT